MSDQITWGDIAQQEQIFESELVTCDCCGEDCTGIENHDMVSFFEKGREVAEILCNGCIKNEIGAA